MNNIDTNEFISKISELKEFASFNGGFVLMENIAEFFPGLDENQTNFIVEYLKNNHIGIDKPIDVDLYMSDDDSKYLKYYLEDLEELEDFDDSKKRVLIMGALNNEELAKEKLIQSYLKDIVDLAKLYSGQGVPIGDIISEGNVALAIAVNMLACVETIDDAKELIVKNIVNAMEEFLGEELDSLKADQKALSLVIKVTDAAKEMYTELCRKVTVDELSKESNISKKKILEAIRITDKCLEYIEKPEDSEE